MHFPGLYIPVKWMKKKLQMECANGILQMDGLHLQFVPKKTPGRMEYWYKSRIFLFG